MTTREMIDAIRSDLESMAARIHRLSEEDPNVPAQNALAIISAIDRTRFELRSLLAVMEGWKAS